MKNNKKVRMIICAVLSAVCLAGFSFLPATAEDERAEMLGRTAALLAPGESFPVRVAVCAVMLNRVKDSGFPDTLPAVISEILASRRSGAGDYSSLNPDGRSLRAAGAALRGADPTRGALYFAASESVPAIIRESGRILFEASGFAFWK